MYSMGENSKETGIGDLQIKRGVKEFYGLGKDRCIMYVGQHNLRPDGTKCDIEFLIDNGYCLGYANWHDSVANKIFTNIQVIKLRTKKSIFKFKIAQKYKKGVETNKLSDYDVKLFKNWAVLRLKNKENPLTMVINYATKKVKRSNEDLNPEAFVNKSAFPIEHTRYENKTRFYRMLLPPKFRSNNPDYKVFIKDYCYNSKGEVILLIDTPDSNILFNASK
jgi:hypothetical protein